MYHDRLVCASGTSGWSFIPLLVSDFRNHEVKRARLLDGRKGNAMNFYETSMGRTFFEHQLPQLISAIQTLTAALDRPVQQITLPVEGDPEFLSELYYGNYEPGIFKSTPEGDRLIQKLNDAYNALAETLSKKSCDRLDRYLEIVAERSAADARLAYESGFRTAVQMMVAGLSRTDIRKEAA